MATCGDEDAKIPEVQFSTCPIFPGEVEDYYCTCCHTPCSGLSLLVGPHTGHSRVPLTQAAKYLPTQLRREASALVADIQEKYVRPKTAHCATLNATLDHLRQERQRKVLELQRELHRLDEKIDSVSQERTIAVCHWSRQRTSFAKQVRRLLRGANAIEKIVGLQAKSSRPRRPTMVSDEMKPSVGLPHHALRVIARELNDVRQLLAQPLEWLEKGETDPRRSCLVLDGDDPVDREKREEFSWRHNCVGGKMHHEPMGKNRSKSKSPVASDTMVVLERLLSAHIEEQKAPPLTKPVNDKKSDISDESLASISNALVSEHPYKERKSWRHDIKRMERVLRAGLDRCLSEEPPLKRATTMGAPGDETDVNDISSSSGGSVSEAVLHLLQCKKGTHASAAEPHIHRHSFSSSPHNVFELDENEEEESSD